MASDAEDNGLLRDIKLCAWGNVFGAEDQKEDGYRLRQIFRWYSREFSTPLHEVEDLPLVQVLTHYFESMYEELGEADGPAAVAATEREELLLRETLAERKARESQEAVEDVEADAFEREVREEVKRQRAERERYVRDQAAIAAAPKRAGAPKELPRMTFPPEGSLNFDDDGDWNLLGPDRA